MGRPSNTDISKKALLAAFGRQYHVIEHDGGYLLYDCNRQSKRANALYLGRFYLSSKGDRYVFNDSYYESVGALVDAMDKYNETLPFSQDIYNPIYRKNYQIECAIHDYLSGLGFVHTYTARSPRYILSSPYGESICVIEVNTKMDSQDGSLDRIISENKWVSADFHDLDSAIGACNSLIVCHCALVQSKLMNVLSSLSKQRASMVLNNTFDIKSLSVYSDDARLKTIQYLEEELKRLKGE